MRTRFPHTLIALAVGCACGGLALAQTSGTTTTAAGTTATPATSGAASGKLVTSFSDIAGSTRNSTALVQGLRTGSAITLTPTTKGSTTGSTTGTGSGSVTFTPPTKPMGYGNIRIALSLARTNLAAQGITQPTPQQLQTALMGSSSTTPTGTSTTGILQMRASGMGWGQIANSMGYKLGAVMSGHVPAAATTAATVTGSGAGTTTAAGTGTTTAAGRPSTASAGQGKSTGIVTAGGGGGSVSTGLGQGHAGAGAGSAAGVMSAQGAAHGQGAGAGGQGKGKP